MASFVTETERHFVSGIEILIDFDVDLLPINVAFETLLSSDETVSAFDPAELCLIQAITAARSKVIR